MVLLVAGGCRRTRRQRLLLDERSPRGLSRSLPRSDGPRRGFFVLAAIATARHPADDPGVGVDIATGRGAPDTGIVLPRCRSSPSATYVHVAPLWVALTASGARSSLLALVVERTLGTARRASADGFTADALFTDDRRQQMLQTVPVVAAFTPAAHIPATEEKGFAGRGGAFGGGGASDKF